MMIAMTWRMSALTSSVTLLMLLKKMTPIAGRQHVPTVLHLINAARFYLSAPLCCNKLVRRELHFPS